MRRSIDRILTTHTGSLPRSAETVALVLAREAGEPVDDAVWDEVISGEVAELVRRQIAAGLDVVSDGEASKSSYAGYVWQRLGGFDLSDATARPMAQDWDDFPEFVEYIHRFLSPDQGHSKRAAAGSLACVGPVVRGDHEAVERDIERFQAATDGLEVEGFMTAASPGVIALFTPNEYYPSHEEYVAAIADAMREEYEAIANAGLVLQVDCPDLAMGRHIGWKDASLQEFRRAAELSVEALNEATRAIDPDQMRMHLCWGNYPGPHNHDVPLADVIDIVLKARPNGIVFEAANPRHGHEWRVFEDIDIPDRKVLIPGVIDSTTNYIEHPDLVAQRLERFVRLVGRERVIAGTDCGFGTGAGTALVLPRIAWRKLESLAEGARLASTT